MRTIAAPVDARLCSTRTRMASRHRSRRIHWAPGTSCTSCRPDGKTCTFRPFGATVAASPGSIGSSCRWCRGQRRYRTCRLGTSDLLWGGVVADRHSELRGPPSRGTHFPRLGEPAHQPRAWPSRQLSRGSTPPAVGRHAEPLLPRRCLSCRTLANGGCARVSPGNSDQTRSNQWLVRRAKA